jgi:transcriptional regulator with PAS, ATPase and Fis domain
MMQYLPKTRKYILVTATPSFDEEGNPYLVVLNERDLTHLGNMREQLEKARQLTEKAKEEIAGYKMLELQPREIVAASQKMRQVLRTAHKLGTMGVSDILISGESGTGKGVVAKFIHRAVNRVRKPFLQINCAALPENLLEAELFGYEKGAFTGAKDSGKVGLFELAHGGILFLDEIGDIPLSLQAKLLKYLDDHEVMRLGAVKSSKVDCMIVAATNQDLEALVEEKKFRDDLYYRLNSFRIEVPPLRERPEDIFELVRKSLSKYNKLYGLNRKISQRGFEAIRSYPFPGNVRELKNLIRMTVIMSERDVLDRSIEESINQAMKSTQDIDIAPNSGRGINLHEELIKAEKEILRKAVNRSKTTRELADLLGVSQPTAFRKMRRHQLSFDSNVN